MMLTGGGPSSTFIYNSIQKHFPISSVVIEERVDRKKFLQRRMKKMGFVKVLGQVLFQLSVPKLLERTSQKRLREIKESFDLDGTPIPSSIIKNVSSVNSKDCIQFLKKEKPDFIIVNGTRIISKKVLNCIDTTFVNTHAGITPQYRGVHGGYWAMANQDRENCGVTVHLVDSGIDTGNILLQKNISPTSNDNFVTYTYLQMGEGIRLMEQVVADFMNDALKTQEAQSAKSQLWYHPTLWYYLYHRVKNGVR